MSENHTYLLLDGRNTPLAKGILIGSAQTEMLQIRVLEDRVGEVTRHEVVQLLGIDDDRALKCRLVRSRNNDVVLERLEIIDPVVRNNLRIPVCFNSFLYTIEEHPQKRHTIRSVDLSCGGIAFYSMCNLQAGARAEVVLPITEQPLIAHIKVLRVNELKNGSSLYAAKFEDLCHDEEAMIRRAVFGIQIDNERKEEKRTAECGERRWPTTANSGGRFRES